MTIATAFRTLLEGQPQHGQVYTTLATLPRNDLAGVDGVRR